MTLAYQIDKTVEYIVAAARYANHANWYQCSQYLAMAVALEPNQWSEDLHAHLKRARICVAHIVTRPNEDMAPSVVNLKSDIQASKRAALYDRGA